MSPVEVASLIPDGYRSKLANRRSEGYEDGPTWLRLLPRMLAEVIDRWRLQVTGPSRYGHGGIAVPVTAPNGPAVLKVIWPHPEAITERLALRRWDGDGAVRLLAADPARWALLLEPADAERDLVAEPIEAACHTIGELLRTLAVPAMPQLPTAGDTLRELPGQLQPLTSIPRRFIEQGQSLCRELLAEPGIDATVTHTDLHFENVLASLRPEHTTADGGADPHWLAIDPQARNAEPAYSVAPALWNRWDEAVGSGNLRSELRRRLGWVCEAAGIDEDRARAWTIIRELQNALWATEDGDEHDLTVAVAVVKAMQG